MDALFLARVQFGFTAAFHYLFPPMTIGLSWMLVIMEAIYLKTKDHHYKAMLQFWTRIFALYFAMGVATGFVQLFAFGNNWSTFSKFVGDVFGTLLAAEGVFAFFLEAGFLGIMLFGWDKVKPKTHFLSTVLVSLGATFSATWIVMANSWMQTPTGYKIIGEGANKRAVIVNLWEVYFNPSFLDRLGHVLMGCWLIGIFFMMSVSAYYMVKKRHLPFARFNLKMSIAFGFIACIAQLISADSTARGVAQNQPIKLAAMEGVFKTEKNTPFSVIGMIDMETETVRGISIPSLLSFLTYHNFTEAVPGLNEFPKENWPNVPLVFYSYRTMIYAWGAMFLYSVVGLYLWWRKKLETSRWYLWLAVFSIFFPYVANTTGWFVAEFGRQPWIVYNVMKTSQGLSKVVSAGDIIASLTMFVIIYSLLLALFLFLLNGKIQHGPVAEKQPSDDAQYRERYILPKKGGR